MTLLTALGVAILGYHPYAEDGGIYLAEIKRALDPALFPSSTEFVSGHLGRIPGFADAVASLVRISGLKLDWLMLATHVLCFWGLLFGVCRLAYQCFDREAARWGAVGLVAVAAGMPLAGTSLMLVDPYLTARTLALVLTVLGISGVLQSSRDRRRSTIVWTLASFLAAVLAHPLMGVYGAGEAVLLVCLLSHRRSARLWGLAAAALALLIAALVQASAPAETADYARVAATRYYWFLSQWQWYELLGAFAPLLILGCIAARSRASRIKQSLERMAVLTGTIALFVAAVFARKSAPVHAVARLQPLRCFQMVYLVLLIMLGGWLGQTILRQREWRWTLAAASLGGLMLFVQRQTYPSSTHLELPGAQPVNRWERAFLWAHDHTPKEALFALDADYVHCPGEDAQVFRAIAERSALPDYSKDGGQTAIRPELTPIWIVGQTVQAGLTESTDAGRIAALKPLGVTWLVMGREARTAFVCPYTNELVMVCRMGP